MTSHTALPITDLATLRAAAAIVYRTTAPTPQYRWPLLEQLCGCTVWLKHENHLPIGAFKLRGGLVYLHHLRATRPEVRHIITATRGNHGQSIALAARAHGIAATIVVPEGNNPEKDAAMRAFGADLVVHGRDFDSALAHARTRAETEGLHFLPSFHPWLVAGVASYGLELLDAVPDLDAVYVPIGIGSGFAAMASARLATGRAFDLYGVVAEAAPAYLLSFQAGEAVTTATAHTLADGVACRVPDPAALRVVLDHARDVVAVDEDSILEAMAELYRCTHNVAEGAGALPLAALLQNRDQHRGQRVGLILCGGNADAPTFARALGRLAG